MSSDRTDGMLSVTCICKVQHDDFTWEYVEVTVDIYNNEFRTQCEDGAIRNSRQAIKELPTYVSTDVISFVAYYDADNVSDSAFWRARLGMDRPNPYARIEVPNAT